MRNRGLRRQGKIKNAEIVKLSETSELWRRKCESLHAEFTDKLLELFGSSGFKPLSEDFRLNDLKDSEFKKPVEPVNLRDTLRFDEQNWYDERFEQHRQTGLALGRSEAEIAALWKEHEEEEVNQIREESFVSS